MTLNFYKKICPHCQPIVAHPWHLTERLENLLFSLDRFLKPPLDFSGAAAWLPPFFHGLFQAMLALRILRVQPVRAADRSIFSRTLALAAAARQRQAKIEALKLWRWSTNLGRLKTNRRVIFFEGLPTLLVGQLAANVDDKLAFKELLRARRRPLAEGRGFSRLASALAYSRAIGWPLVVKPRLGSLSRHVTVNIRSEPELKEAIRVAKLISPEFIVEKFIPGQVFRLTLVGYKLTAVCQREPANVVGDGRQSISQLIELKNTHQWRGDQNERNKTLHKISTAGLSPDLLRCVPAAGEKVYLHKKVILAAGADIHDCTTLVHPANRRLFEELAKACRLPVIGFDFICPDIRRPYFSQRCAVIEANSSPLFDMHHYPVTGAAQDVAGRVMDYVLANLVSREKMG